MPVFVRTGGQYLSELVDSTCICRSSRPVSVFVGTRGQYLYLSESVTYLYLSDSVASTFIRHNRRPVLGHCFYRLASTSTVRASGQYLKIGACGQYLYWSEPVASTSIGHSQWPVPLLVEADSQYLYCQNQWLVPLLIETGGQYLYWPQPVDTAGGQYLYWSEPVASTSTGHSLSLIHI